VSDRREKNAPAVSAESARGIVNEKTRQLSDVCRDAPRLVAGEQVRGGAPSGLLLEIDERMSVVVADDEALLAPLHVRVIDRPQGGGKRRVFVCVAFAPAGFQPARLGLS
jgi:hypothetical protein